jgi:octaprenyl-diphosphate synthase
MSGTGMAGADVAGTARGGSSQLAEIQAPVRADLEKVASEMWRMVAEDFPLIDGVNQHLMGMKGKMFRPTLLLLANAVEERRDPRATTLAAALELIHLGTLVHDDAVDHSVLRRGMPTVNALFSHQISVIMGDFMYTRALRELVRVGDMEIMRVITQASNDMTLGEMRQLAAFDKLSFTEDDYDLLIKAKTASLMGAATEVGALVGAPRHREALGRFGLRLGMAFQVADDLLDYTATADVTGKPTGLDLREHKVTIPLIAALREMRPTARARVELLFATPEPTDEQVNEVIALVAEHGGLDYARRKGDEFVADAEESLADLPETPARASLHEAIAYVLDRRW